MHRAQIQKNCQATSYCHEKSRTRPTVGHDQNSGVARFLIYEMNVFCAGTGRKSLSGFFHTCALWIGALLSLSVALAIAGFASTPTQRLPRSTRASVADSTSPGWIIIPSPNQPGATNSLSAITCDLVIDCWAIGTYAPPSASSEGLFEHWPGNSFVIGPSPKTQNFDTYVNVACSPARDCWAVGNSFGIGTD
jgi:hypothetical protein